MADKWFDDQKSFEHMRENFTTAFRINGGANMNLPEMAEKLCQMRDEIERLRTALSDGGDEIVLLRSVVKNQKYALAPFAFALRISRQRLGEMPDKEDVTSLACRFIAYENLKDALSIYNKYSEPTE